MPSLDGSTLSVCKYRSSNQAESQSPLKQATTQQYPRPKQTPTWLIVIACSTIGLLLLLLLLLVRWLAGFDAKGLQGRLRLELQLVSSKAVCTASIYSTAQLEVGAWRVGVCMPCCCR
jgi:hypothetical protein